MLRARLSVRLTVASVLLATVSHTVAQNNSLTAANTALIALIAGSCGLVGLLLLITACCVRGYLKSQLIFRRSLADEVGLLADAEALRKEGLVLLVMREGASSTSTSAASPTPASSAVEMNRLVAPAPARTVPPTLTARVLASGGGDDAEDVVVFVNPLYQRRNPVPQRLVVHHVRQITAGLVFVTPAGHLLRRNADGNIILQDVNTGDGQPIVMQLRAMPDGRVVRDDPDESSSRDTAAPAPPPAAPPVTAAPADAAASAPAAVPAAPTLADETAVSVAPPAHAEPAPPAAAADSPAPAPAAAPDAAPAAPAPEAVPPEPGAPVHAGTLERRGRFATVFRRQHAALYGDRLVFTLADDPTAGLTVDLATLTGVVPQPAAVEAHQGELAPHRFDLLCGGQTIALQAPSAADKAAWLAALRRVRPDL